VDRTSQELQDKLNAAQGKHHANNVETAEEANLKLVPGAVTVKRASGNKHGLHRTSQELQDKLNAAQGKHTTAITSQEHVATTVAEVRQLPYHGLNRTQEEREAKMHATLLGRTSATVIRNDITGSPDATSRRAPDPPISAHDSDLSNDSQSQDPARVTELHWEDSNSSMPQDQRSHSDEENPIPATPQSLPTPSSRSPAYSLVRSPVSSSNQELVVARPVTEASTRNILQEAQQVDAVELENRARKEQKERECRRVGYCLIAIFLIVFAVTVGLVFGTRKLDVITSAPLCLPPWHHLQCHP
jgi:hypothetical protein